TEELRDVDAVADSQCRRRRLIDHRLEAEQVEIHLHGGRSARRDGEVAGVLERDDALLRRWLRPRAHGAKRAAAAAVVHVMQLEDDAARIGGEQIARAAIPRSAFVGASHTNECLLRSGLRRVRWCGAEAL